MGNPESALNRLGQQVAKEQDEQLHLALDPHGRERLLTAVAPRPRPSRRPKRMVWGSLVAAAATVGLLLLFLGQRPLGFSIGSNAGASGSWIAPAPGQTIPVVFSDGTMFQVKPTSSCRVASVEANGARLVLETGALDASVVKREGAHWLLDAGPYLVVVTGTRFHLAWDPEDQRLALSLEEGSVVVSGPLLDEPLTVRAGHTLDVHRKAGRFELRETHHSSSGALTLPGQSADAPSLNLPFAPSFSAPGPKVTPPQLMVVPRSSSAPEPMNNSSWRELVANGRYREALQAAERVGFDRLCEEGNAAEVRDLGDTARLSGNLSAATMAFSALRRRFPGDDQAADAAFLLGIVAFDQRSAYADAAQWFATYLRERPKGILAREAAGRLFEAYGRAGEKENAREAAQRYLRDHPNGPHAAAAKSLVDE